MGMRFVAALALAGCAGAPRPKPTGPAPGKWPLCGVLSEMGYHDEDQLAFLVPNNPRGQTIRRYVAVDDMRHPAPAAVYAGWWICITAGRLEREPAGDRYGLLHIEDFSIDQTTGERGQE
jgi:hypothetical protein